MAGRINLVGASVTLPLQPPFTLGVIADTHIPDRAHHLNPRVLTIFHKAKVSAILHAGDVSTPGVLAQLSKMAPVFAVRGNRDFLLVRQLPLERVLNFGGISIALAHGHGRWWNYLVDRLDYLANGYRLERFLPRLLEAFPEAQVIVFGHTHHPVNQWVGEQLLFNPGSPHFPENGVSPPSLGLLHVRAGETVSGEIIALEKP